MSEMPVACIGIGLGAFCGDLPNKNALAVIPIVWAITMPVGVFWVSKLSIVRE